MKKAIKDLKKSKKDNILQIARRYRDISMIYREKNDFRKMDNYYGRYLNLLTKTLGHRNPEFLFISIEYSFLLKLRGMYKLDSKLLKNTKKELRTVLKLNIFLKADYKLAKGYRYLTQKKSRKSLIKLEEAKEVYYEYYGKNHPSYISSCLAIGDNFKQQGYLDQALEIYKGVFEKYQRLYSYFHFNCAIILFNIGEIHREKGNISSSLKFYNNSLHVLKNLGLQNTYSTKTIYICLANLYLRIGKNPQVQYYLKKSKDLKAKDNIGKDIFKYAYLEIIGTYLQDCFELGNAKKVYLKYLKSLTFSEQYNLYDIIRIVGKLAKIEAQMSDSNFSKANKYFSICKQLYMVLLSKGHIPIKNTLVIDILRVKAKMYLILNKDNELFRTLRTIIKLELQFYKENDTQMFSSYYNISMVLGMLFKYKESLNMYKRALKIELKTYGNPRTLSTIYLHMGFAYYRIERFDLAALILKKRVHIRKKIGSQRDTDSKKDYHNIGICYLKLNLKDRALKYFNKALSNKELSSCMSLEDTCVWNSIGFAYAFMNLRHKARDIFKVCLENAKANKFDEKYVLVPTVNIQVIDKSVETCIFNTQLEVLWQKQ